MKQQTAKPKDELVIMGASHQRVDLVRSRILLIGLVFLMVFGIIGARLSELATRSDENVAHGVTRSNPLMIARPDLLDRNGEVLATDLTTVSLSAEPKKVISPEEAVEKLATVIPDLKRERTLRRLRSNADFAWIEREITPAQQQAILNLGIPGLFFPAETRRFYPGGVIASHAVGYVDVDNHGIAGFEKFVDEHWLEDLRAVGFANEYRPKPVHMSIDLKVQHAVRDELEKAMKRYQAKGAVGVVLNAKTGEVMALSSLPDYDPNDPKGTLSKETLNKATAGVFEMGSTFKSFTVAMALDSGRVHLNDHFDARKPIRVGRFTIRDFHAQRRILSVPEVFTYSSNIGSVKMAETVGVQNHHDFLARLGLFSLAHHELPEVGRPIEPKEWKEISSMTASFGHGISVTPLQTAAAAAALLNGGNLIPPTFRPRSEAEAQDLAVQVISPQTSAAMRYLFRLNVEKGSGRRAEVEGYFVGGKTGTAEKVVNGKYSSKKKLNSFLSTFPADDPRYVMLVMLDEPQPEEGKRGATAGLNAAPTTARIIRRIALPLGVQPRLEHGPTILSIRN